MIALARKQFRSWMFIYAGLVAAIILSAPPAGVDPGNRADSGELPAASGAPLLRRDI